MPRTLCLMVWLLCSALYASTGLATPESGVVEVSEPRIPKVSRAVALLMARQQISGAVVIVQHRGQLLHFRAQGYRDLEEEDPLERDDILRFYSMTKPIVSAAILMLVEDGKLELDAPIAQYIPEFQTVKVQEKKGLISPRRPPTVRDLLTHTAGLTYGFFSKTDIDKAYMANHPLFSRTNQEMVTKLSQHPLMYHPGEQWHYSMATDVLGHLIETVTEQSLAEFLQERIFTPLRMVDTAFHVPATKQKRFASAYTYRQKLQERYTESDFLDPNRIQSGGGGLVSTAQDYLHFCQLLLNEGEWNGVRLLRAESVRAMTQNQLPEGLRAYQHFGFGFGLQVQLLEWGIGGRKGEYGWDGAASTHFWVSPEDELIVIALSQRRPYTPRLKQVLLPIVYREIQGR